MIFISNTGKRMFPIMNCIAVRREVWYTRQGMLLIKIRSCRTCLTCSNRLGAPKPSVGQNSDKEWLVSSEARIWKAEKQTIKYSAVNFIWRNLYIQIKYCDPKENSNQTFLNFKLEAPEIEFRARKRKPGRTWWKKIYKK